MSKRNAVTAFPYSPNRLPPAEDAEIQLEKWLQLASEWLKPADELISTNPGIFLGFAAAAGFLLGCWVKRK